MRTVINFFKKRTPFEIGIFILVLAIVIVYTFSRYIDNPSDPITKYVDRTVTVYKDRLGQETAKIATNSQPSIKGVDPAEYQRVLDALGIKEDQILAYNNIEAKLQDSLKIAKLSLDEANNKLWSWESKKPSGSVIKAVMNEKDSILHTEVDLKLNTTEYVEKGGLFKKDKLFTDIYSSDQNIKINGVKSFRKETIIRPKRIGIGLQVGYGVTGDLKPSLYVGAGISYNLINF